MPKEERQRRREEAKLKSIYGPKDSKVSFIDASVLQKLNRNTAPKSNAASFLSPDDFPSISSTSRSVAEDFPALGPISSKVTKKGLLTSVQLGSSSYSSTVPSKPSTSDESSRTQPEEESAWEDENEGAGDSTGNKSNTGSTEPLILGAVPEPTSTKRKSKAPLLISLDALITVPAEKEKRKNAKKLKELKVAAEKKTVGNALDSSGPMLMNRGKIRNRKKKVSALKKTIITGRLLRKQMMESKSEDKRVDLPKSYRSSTQITEDLKTQRLGPLELESAHISSTVVTAENNSQGNVPHDIVSMAMVSKSEPVSEQSIGVPTSVDDSFSDTSKVRDIPSSPMTRGNAEVDLFARLLDNAIQEQVIEKIPKSNVGEDIVQTPCETKPEGVSPEVYEKAKQSLHSRKFRAYCNMFVSKELHGHVIALMKELHRFQDRLYHTDRVKYQTKRRYVHGIKDALSYLRINKVVLIILSPDIERNNVEGMRICSSHLYAFPGSLNKLYLFCRWS